MIKRIFLMKIVMIFLNNLIFAEVKKKSQKPGNKNSKYEILLSIAIINVTAGLKYVFDIFDPNNIAVVKAKPIAYGFFVIMVTDKNIKVPINSMK